MDLAVIYRQSLDLWQNPSYTELSIETQLACANRCITQFLLDLDLTPGASFRFKKSSVFQFNTDSREKDLSGVIQDISRPVRVESRNIGSTSEDDWSEETITAFDNWNDTVERGDGDFVAFYGTPPSLKMVIARDASNLEFRVIYPGFSSKVTNVNALLELPDIYEPLLVYDIALEYGEIIDNQSEEFTRKKAQKMPYLLERRKDAFYRIEKWRKNQTGSSVTTRRPFNDRGGLVPGRRRFTVTG